VLIADEMGLGKTLQAVCLACYFHHDWPLLIVCPASLKFNWKAELLRVCERHKSTPRKKREGEM